MFGRKIDNFFFPEKELEKINPVLGGGGGQSVYRQRTGFGLAGVVAFVNEWIKIWLGV
jgi:hypothetical protein